MTSYSALPNKLVRASDGVDYAYRKAGQGELPLILLQHFRGNLDGWDPGWSSPWSPPGRSSRSTTPGWAARPG